MKTICWLQGKPRRLYLTASCIPMPNKDADRDGLGFEEGGRQSPDAPTLLS